MLKTMDHAVAVQLVKEIGLQKFLEKLEAEYKLDFYGISKDWLNNSQFICKLRGTKGDLIIQWA